MPDLPQKKVGIIACSGEELPCGTATREAALLVLERLRPLETVTLCLPLFLAGEERERAFARFFPTIAVDGCDKRCAARATEEYSAPPAASLVLDELISQLGLEAPRNVRGPEEARSTLAAAAAAAIAQEVDRLLGKHGIAVTEESASSADIASEDAAVCSCTSGIPVERLQVNGKTVELVALPAIFELVSQQGHDPDDGTTADAILELARVYNSIASEDEQPLRPVLAKAYAEYLSDRSEREGPR
ncbi:MAG TPA: putative zinc-binding protein [Dehalococcoidia bacterium]|nr:putative zinc-binding protein [Dehalococcoidia bacterium]